LPGLVRQPEWPLTRTTRADVRAGLDEVLREALLRPPCGVFFSGGRDSSVLLAAAVDLARREGHEVPAAVTLRFPDAGDHEEEAWQQLVVDHVKPVDWVKVEVHDEFDLVGPTAAPRLRRRGLTWPALAHNADLLLPGLRGGTLVDGEGGDEILGARRSSPVAQLMRRKRPPGRRLLRELRSATGSVALRWREAAAQVGERPWLMPDAAYELALLLVQDGVGEPLSWPRSVQFMADRRAVVVAMANLDEAARDFDVTRMHPFLDPRFLVPWAGFGGRFGFDSRTEAMRSFVDDLLPEVVLRRASKAVFNSSAVHRHARAFIEQWDGTGVDPAIVDVDALRAEWQSPHVHAGTFLLLQQAWLASNGGGELPD
jgi:asparagine synthase (glutamine-hydrolysing)